LDRQDESQAALVLLEWSFSKLRGASIPRLLCRLVRL
jgi:hypothetical protein